MNAVTDISTFINALTSPFVCLDERLIITMVNDAYLRVTRRVRGDLVGNYFFDVFKAEAFENGSGFDMLRASMLRALRTRIPDVVTSLCYTPTACPKQGGHRECRYWNAVSVPLIDSDGHVIGICNSLFDTTDIRSLKRQLRDAEVTVHALADRALDTRLLDNERRLLKQLIEKTPSFTALLRGHRHVFELVNSSFRALIGNRHVLGRPHAEALPELTGAGLLDLLNKVYESGKAHTGKGMRITLQNGPHGAMREAVLDFVYQPLTDPDGAVSGILMQGHDISEQKRVEHELRTVSKWWESALEGAGDGVWDWNTQTGEAKYSRRWKEMLGYAEHEIKDTYEEWSSRVHPDDVEAAASALQDCIEERAPYYAKEHRVRHKDGTWLFILSRARIFDRDSNGKARRIIGTFTDISGIRQLSEQLRQSHELLTDLSEQVPGVLFQFRRYPDGQSAFPFTSHGLIDTHEVAPHEVMQDSMPIFRTLHPQDVAAVNASIEESARTLTPWNHEFRMILPRQGLCWRHGIAKPKKLDDGSIVWHGFISDITSRKAAEEELGRLALVAKKITTSVTITDARGVVEWVNPAFTVMTGYTLKEVVGRTPGSLLCGPDTNQTISKQMRDAILEGKGFDVDVLNYHKSGQPFWQHIKADPVTGPDGTLQHFIAVQTDISEKKKVDDLIWKQANYDTLTSLPNRRLFRDRLDQEMKKARRTGKLMALLFIDLDHFKEANDLLGHDGGDMLLKQAADRINCSVRDSDTVARLGGDEFTVILTGLDDSASVDLIAQKIVDAMREPFLVQGETFMLSASIGVTMYPADAFKSADLIKHADQAMYAAKSSGRNQFSHFTWEMQQKAEERYYLSMDLRDALAKNQLSVLFQPVQCLKTGRIVKAEALLRWNHPRRGLIDPAIFIPAAEENGTIHSIGDWVFRQAAHWSRRWSRGRPRPFQISVNKSPVQFLSQGSDKSWPAILREMGMPVESILVEITEGVLMNASSTVTEKLLHYHNEGMQIALDDFGTGYSSMLYLKKFDIDFLKIDQSFIKDMTTDLGSRTIAETIILMAHKLGMKVVAEGIETLEQKAMLKAADCDLGQGFLFSGPLLPEEFEALLDAADSLNAALPPDSVR